MRLISAHSGLSRSDNGRVERSRISGHYRLTPYAVQSIVFRPAMDHQHGILAEASQQAGEEVFEVVQNRQS